MTVDAHYNDDLRLIHILAGQAGAITPARFGAQNFVIDSKSDLIPVTNTDRAVEDMIRSRLTHTRSRDSVVDEERGTSGHTSWRWIVDPIDDTKDFVHGVPVWTTLIGLVGDREVVMDVVSAPALKHRWWTVKGQGSFVGTSLFEGRKLSVSSVAELSDTSLSYSSLGSWLHVERDEEFLRMLSQLWRTRTYGDFWSYMLVAEGAIDTACKPELELYDMMVLAPIAAEAGGRFTSLRTEEGPWGGNALATNGLLHERLPHIFDWPGFAASDEE